MCWVFFCFYCKTQSLLKATSKRQPISTSAIQRHTYVNKPIRNNSRSNACAKFSLWKRWTNTKAEQQQNVQETSANKKERTVNKKKIHNTCRICREKKKTLKRRFASELLVWHVYFRRSLIYTLSLSFFSFYFCLCHLLNAV